MPKAKLLQTKNSYTNQKLLTLKCGSSEPSVKHSEKATHLCSTADIAEVCAMFSFQLVHMTILAVELWLPFVLHFLGFGCSICLFPLFLSFENSKGFQNLKIYQKLTEALPGICCWPTLWVLDARQLWKENTVGKDPPQGSVHAPPCQALHTLERRSKDATWTSNNPVVLRDRVTSWKILDIAAEISLVWEITPKSFNLHGKSSQVRATNTEPCFSVFWQSRLSQGL